MKKLLGIIVLSLLWCTKSYAELEELKLTCVVEDKTVVNTVYIFKGGPVGIVNGNPADLVETADDFILTYTIAEKINATLAINRNTGLYNMVWYSKENDDTLLTNGKCHKAKKKF